MIRVKELAKWLKKSVRFLEDNKEYVGEWKKLDDTYCAVVIWEEGWGEEKRDDVIQSQVALDWGLCAGIKIYNKKQTMDVWFYPWDRDSGDLLTESTGISPKEDFEQMAVWILDEYKKLDGLVPAEDGSIVKSPEEEEETAVLEPDSAEGEEDVPDEENHIEEPVEVEPEHEVEEAMTVGDTNTIHSNLPLLEQDIYDFLSEKNIFPDNLNLVERDGKLVLTMVISGDWKHDHLFTEHLIDEWCGDNKFSVVSHDKRQIGESDSDWFEAEHTWELSY